MSCAYCDDSGVISGYGCECNAGTAFAQVATRIREAQAVAFASPQRHGLESEKEVHEGRAVLLAEGDPIDMVWGIHLEPGATADILELGAIASVERWRGKRIRVTVEEIPE
jgi:hypothetical protein